VSVPDQNQIRLVQTLKTAQFGRSDENEKEDKMVAVRQMRLQGKAKVPTKATRAVQTHAERRDGVVSMRAVLLQNNTERQTEMSHEPAQTRRRSGMVLLLQLRAQGEE
jgi:hypothetical protein